MLSGLERETSWSLAGHAGEATPDGMQRLFTTARWDTGGVRDDVRGYVAAALGSPDGVLIGDDTGFEKGGSLPAGVQRQYTGTAGKITNCQLGVFLACASAKGRALVDRELCLPRSWTGDGQRLAAAGVPEGTRFRTKPQLLEMMIERAVAGGIPFGWVTADEAYGDNGPLRSYLEGRGISYVLAVARAHVLATPAGGRRADALAAKLPRRAWQRMSCGDGAKGRRRCDWALVASVRTEISLLIRRNVSRPSELAFCLCHTPGPAPLSRLVTVAGARWAVEGADPPPGQPLRSASRLPRTKPGWTTTRSGATRAGTATLPSPCSPLPSLPSPGPLSQTATRAWPARPTRSAACSPRSAHRPATSSTPATGHDGATTTKNAPAAATASDNDCKCREPIYLSSASWGFRAS